VRGSISVLHGSPTAHELSRQCQISLPGFVIVVSRNIMFSVLPYGFLLLTRLVKARTGQLLSRRSSLHAQNPGSITLGSLYFPAPRPVNENLVKSREIIHSLETGVLKSLRL
jgi:hypothetical protein